MDDNFIQTLMDLKDDGSYNNALERLYVISKIETGLEQAEGGTLQAQRSVWAQMRGWIQ